MASVDVLTAARIQELINGTVASVDIDGSGFLTATLGDGSTIDIGTVITTAVTDQLVKTASINGSKHLILTLGDGSTQIDVGGLYVTGASINGSNHLILTFGNGSTADVGALQFVKTLSIDSNHHLQMTDGAGTVTDLGLVNPVFGVAKTGTTARSSTTLTADPHLTLTGLKAGTYTVEMALYWNADATGDSSIDFTVSSATLEYATVTLGLSATDTTGLKLVDNTAGSPTTNGGLPGSSVSGQMLMGTLVVSADGGACTLKWGLATASGSTSLRSGSFMKLTKIT